MYVSRMKRLATVMAAVALLPLAASTPGQAQSPAAGQAAPQAAGGAAGRATFQGRVVDLSLGWQGARSCVVFKVLDTRCFASNAEADAATGYRAAAGAVQPGPVGGNAVMAATSTCPSGWLCLYEDVNGGGRRLIFNDEYWHYLDDWGFNRKTSSWRNAQGSGDPGHLSLYNSPSVYNCPAGGYASQMGNYNDQAYAVWG